jgi:precorrin-6B methylase 2
MNKIRNVIRKIVFNITGINSISAAINPIFYIEKLFFIFFVLLNKKNILSGKFKTMKFYNNVRGSEFKPKYFGSYEDELDPFFTKFKGSFLIDIGCDDGYYSIGLLKFNFVDKVYAFEFNPNSINYFNENVKHNLILKDKIILTEKMVTSFDSIKFCFHENHSYTIKCDIEGGEYEIFNDEMLNSLKKFNCNFIIETHLNDKLESDLIKKFNDHNYKVEIVNKNLHKSYCEEYNYLNSLMTNLFKKNWLNEHRPQFNRWIVVTIK